MILRKAYYLGKIYQNQWKSREDIERLQLKLLRQIVRHAYNTVPYYHNIFNRINLHPNDIKELKDINKIPIITKDGIRDLSVDQRISKSYSHKKLNVCRTSGSSGKPLEIYYETSFGDLRSASIFRTYLANKYKVNKKIAVLQYYPLPQKILEKLGFFQRFEVPFNAPISEQIQLLKKFNPYVLEGFPSRIVQIASEIIHKKIRGITPGIIVTNSETLTENAKKIIKTAFGIEPTIVYDCWEFGNIAWECPKHEGLHINSDLLYVQIIKDGEEVINNESGEIIVTSMYNFISPLLRYNMEDRGIKKENPCSCGRVFPLLKEIIGRKSEAIVLSNGTEITATAIGSILINFSSIIEYQAVQYEKGKLTLYLVPRKSFNKKVEKEMKIMLGRNLKLDEISLKCVDKIKRTKAGKLRPFISEIKQQRK